jgi:hypothetical protein
MFNGLSTLLRLVSRAACLIVIASFALFATDQAGSASAHQQNEVNSAAPASVATVAPPAPSKHKSPARRTLDEASEALTSPFSGVTSGSGNEWVVHGGDTVLALLLYGFGLGFLARVLRVRV